MDLSRSLIQSIRQDVDSVDQKVFVSIQDACQIGMAIMNLAIQEDVLNALALADGKMKGVLLGESNRRVCCSDAEDRGRRRDFFQFRRGISLTLLMRSVESGPELRPKSVIRLFELGFNLRHLPKQTVQLLWTNVHRISVPRP